MLAIIFGVHGQDGYYLTQLLKAKYIKVLGVARSGKNCLVGDISERKFVENTIKKYKPNYIFHLAAVSTTKHEALFENHAAISTGTLNILESVRLHCPQAKVFLSGSAMQFANKGKPINEKTPFAADSAYAVARIQSVYAARYFREKFNLKVYVGYFFNHDSALRPEQHVNQKIIAAVKRIAKGSKEKITLGDISVRKEFNYAGDIVKAVWALVSQEAVYEAVLGSGQAYSIKDWVKYCFEKIGQPWKKMLYKIKLFGLSISF